MQFANTSLQDLAEAAALIDQVLVQCLDPLHTRVCQLTSGTMHPTQTEIRTLLRSPVALPPLATHDSNSTYKLPTRHVHCLRVVLT